MADTLKRAQVAPAAGTWTMLFQAVAQTVISTVRVSNTSSSIDSIDIRVVYAGEAEATKQYAAEAVPVPRGRPFSVTEGWTLLADDTIFVRSRLGLSAFQLFGVEKV